MSPTPHDTAGACPQRLPALPSRVLVRGVNWLGDSVMTMPAIRRLREAMPPNGHLALLIPEKVAPLWQQNPHVDEIIPLRRDTSELAQARALKKKDFQLAVIFPNSFRSAMLPFLAGIPRRAGYHGHSRRALLTESFPADTCFKTRSRLADWEIRALVNHWKSHPFPQHRWPMGCIRHEPPAPPPRHQSLHYLELIGKLGADTTPCAPKIFLSADEMEYAKKFLPTDRPTLGVAPCAEYGPAKRWPLERFAKTLLRLRTKTDCNIAIFGAQSDRAECSALADEITKTKGTATISVLAGKTTLRELCACIARCRVLLTNDTGPMHLAVAVGTPVVAIFGSTEPALTGPNYPGCAPTHIVVRRQVECSPCFLRECPIDFRCMNRISPDEVTEAVLQCLKQP